MNRLVLALTFVVLAGCSQGDTPVRGVAAASAPQQQGAAPAAPVFGLASAASAAGTTYEARIRQQRAFADLPDRGELLSYPRSNGVQDTRTQGAYTWHRVEISEEHALRAIASGRLRVPTPSGQTLDIRYDRHVEHPSGDLSWIGHIEGQPGAQTIITFGAEAVYGSIGQPGKRSLRLTMRNGAGWIVETDPVKLAGTSAAKPRKPDFLAMPKARRSVDASPVAAKAPAAAVVVGAAAATATATIDLLVGYTPGFASKGSSAAMTRLNQMVTAGNEALANSQVNARIRLVHAMQVNYADNTSNEDALEQLTGYDSDDDRYTTPNSAFNALRAARETYGADLVTLVRAFREPEQDGCGIAWLIGGGRTEVRPGDGSDYFGYSVVSDGEDDSYFCREETLIHELAHNMGSQHDRESAQGSDGNLDPDDYGAFTYSFGYRTTASVGNFYTVMAYGDEGQTDYRVFSNPRIKFCGGRACGTTTYEDNARSLGEIAPVIARFRLGSERAQHNDLDGDGDSDLLWRGSGAAYNVILWYMSGKTRAGTEVLYMNAAYQVAATGDFNGDGVADMVWRRGVDTRLRMWLSNGAGGYSGHTIEGYGSGWTLAGAGDLDGDGDSDLLWRGSGAAYNVILWYMSGKTRAGTEVLYMNTGYQVAATGDFNGDGLLDIVWRRGIDTRLRMWLSNGAGGYSGHTVEGYGSGWTLAGAGDLDGDGDSDLLWRGSGSTYNVILWYMNGKTRAGTEVLYMNTGYQVAATGDFNGDGMLDMVWRRGVDTRLRMWLSNGAGGYSGHTIEGYGSGWKLVP